MSLLENRVSSDDIQRVYEHTHHGKFSDGFENQSENEIAWTEINQSNGKPYGYMLFSDIQREFDNKHQNEVVKEVKNDTGIKFSSNNSFWKEMMNEEPELENFEIDFENDDDLVPIPTHSSVSLEKYPIINEDEETDLVPIE